MTGSVSTVQSFQVLQLIEIVFASLMSKFLSRALVHGARIYLQIKQILLRASLASRFLVWGSGLVLMLLSERLTSRPASQAWSCLLSACRCELRSSPRLWAVLLCTYRLVNQITSECISLSCSASSSETLTSSSPKESPKSHQKQAVFSPSYFKVYHTAVSSSDLSTALRSISF